MGKKESVEIYLISGVHEDEEVKAVAENNLSVKLSNPEEEIEVIKKEEGLQIRLAQCIEIKVTNHAATVLAQKMRGA